MPYQKNRRDFPVVLYMAVNAIAYLRKIEHALKAKNATEHTHRPALKELIEALRHQITATNEARRIECGSPDYIVTQKGVPLGYVEAKDVGVDLDCTEESEQLKRYRSSLRNLILTDYLEFHLYRNGESVQSIRLAKWQKNGFLRREPDAETQLTKLFEGFSMPMSRVSPTRASWRSAWREWPGCCTT